MSAVGYFDGTAEPNSGPASIGIVLTCSNGKTVYEEGRAIECHTNHEAAYLALIALLLKAQERGIKRIHIRGDSQLVIQQITKKWKIKEKRLADLAVPIWILVHQEFDHVSFEWVRRGRNQHADQLSKAALLR